jgi:PAS domain S-box-containing protein
MAASETRLSAEQVLEALGHAVIVTDLAGVVRYWSRAAERLYGWTAAEAVGRGIESLTVPQVTQAFAEQIMQTLREGGRWSGGFGVRRNDGSTFTALVTDTPVRDAAGDLVGIVGVSTDLGHAVRPLLAQSADAALLLTDDAKVSYISPAATRLFGWNDTRLLGVSLFSLVHPDDRATAGEYYQRVTASRELLPPLECRLLGRDDAWCWTDLLLTNAVDEPAIRGLVCHVRDVTERRHAELRRTRHAAITELVAGITASVLADEPLPGLHQRVVEGAARILAATHAGLFLPNPLTGRVELVAAAGPVASPILSGQIRLDDTWVSTFLQRGPATWTGRPTGPAAESGAVLGPIALARFAQSAAGQGVLAVARAPGGDPFTATDADLLATLASHVTPVIGLGRARADQHRLTWLEERTRIARDLHDIVMQDLMAIGMQLDLGLRRQVDDQARRERDATLISQLEAAIRRLRVSVSELREPPSGQVVSDTIRTIIQDASSASATDPA